MENLTTLFAHCAYAYILAVYQLGSVGDFIIRLAKLKTKPKSSKHFIQSNVFDLIGKHILFRDSFYYTGIKLSFLNTMVIKDSNYSNYLSQENEKFSLYINFPVFFYCSLIFKLIKFESLEVPDCSTDQLMVFIFIISIDIITNSAKRKLSENNI